MTACGTITDLFLSFTLVCSGRSFPIISFVLVLSVSPRKLQLGTKEAQMPAKESPTMDLSWVVGSLLTGGKVAH